jgi:hypothetical protein
MSRCSRYKLPVLEQGERHTYPITGDREKLIAHVEKLQGLIDKMRVDKDAAVREYDLLTIKSKQMKMDYDELREVFFICIWSFNETVPLM